MMKALKEFVIPFVGLKEGIHDYAFDIDARFFESFENSEIIRADVHVDVSLERQERMLIFNFTTRGTLVLSCDRCLGELEMPVEGTDGLIVKFGQEYEEESDEIIVIPEKESHIDISTYIFEYIMLKLPIQRVHPEGEGLCDPEVISKLNEHRETERDPRWAALEQLRNKTE
ncbi:MAG: DUF177 domain-containing protein [Bacteroidales bacterium]|jgi:uncharacterized metal-binding protein YceD (DUF177 family)|nr:DUF177 domain-containing protein [Bacteroidales bacterium]